MTNNSRALLAKLMLVFTFMLSFQGCMNEQAEINLIEKAKYWTKTDNFYSEGDVYILKEAEQAVYYLPGEKQPFKDFELQCEFKTHPGAKAGIRFHTHPDHPDQGYEIRLDNNPGGVSGHLIKTGSLSDIRNAYYTMVENDEWFTLRVLVKDRRIQVQVNALPVVDYIEPSQPFRPEGIENRMLGEGSFALVSHEGHSSIEIRKMVVTKLESGEPLEVEDPDFQTRITELHYRQLPVVDYHVHEKGGLTMEQLLAQSARKGINYGIAANCGLKFPIENDEQLEAYLESMHGLPVFKAMQAEGREWVDMFSPELVAGFDYVFTDAMTWTNNRGTRMRLWLPEETEVGDPEDFMEQLVSQIEKVVSEPIAIYVNPCFLPEEIADRWDALWTDERIDRVVEALKTKHVALELNSRYKLPGDRMIAKAKEAGVKFAFGTNNTGADDLGQLEWSLEKAKQFNLQAEDIFLPGGE